MPAPERVIIWQWTDDGVMKPQSRFDKLCDEIFVVGELYRMATVGERSLRSHNHYFACLGDAWDNLPEPLKPRFPSVDHLRKFALIHTGYCDERHMVCADADNALRLAAFLRPLDEFAVVDVRGDVITVYTAKSQSYQAMKEPKEFQKSKQDVLEFISAMIGVTVEELKRNAKERVR